MKIILTESQLRFIINEQYNFNMGDCDVYAVALHRIYGYPIYALYGFYYDETDELNYEIYHIMVKTPDGKYKDSNGEFSLDELKPLVGLGHENILRIRMVSVSEDEALSIFSMSDQEEDILRVIDMIKSGN